MRFVRHFIEGLQAGIASADTLARACAVIAEQKAQIEHMRLEHARNTRNLIEHFYLAQERGLDVREPLLNGLRDLNDEVARLEEHIT